MSSSVASFDLALPIAPWVVVARDDDRVAREKVAAFASGGVVRRLDSRRMTDTDGLPRSRPPVPLHVMFFLARGDVREVAEGLSVRDDMLIRECDGRLLVWSQSE
ncbi:hypothetical protein ACGFH8_26085 [Micromonospora sp. NPDC049175]|uniref:hypothetical protein n=1 Tax=Micromonospora sp. NPDC049175 TaxID=3364266 RepID=UPI003718F04B